jgi:hypothetical protein
MVGLLRLAVAASAVVCTVAFSPTLSSHTNRLVVLNRKSCALSQYLQARKPSIARMRMSEAAKDVGAPEIDFSKVAFNDGSESGFSGMVFRPEDSEEPESRCRVDWDVKCEKVCENAATFPPVPATDLTSLFPGCK